MEIKILIACLIVHDIILTFIVTKLFFTIGEAKLKSEIDRIEIEYLKKQCNLSIDSIDLLTKSLKDLNGIVKKFVVGNEDTADTKPDTSALIAGWKADEQEKQELFSVDEVRDSIVNACNSGMLLQSALLAQGFAQTQCIYPLQQSAIMPPMWNTSNVSRKLGD